MSEFTIWHNPRCSKSRQALVLLRENGVDPVVVHYLTQPPGEAQLRTARDQLGVSAYQMMRIKEKRFAELGLSKDSADDDLIRAMAANPVLIERPIVFRGEEAVIGRPTEAVLTLL